MLAYSVFHTIILAYGLSTIVFLLISFIVKNARKRINAYLNKANSIIIVVLTLQFLLISKETWACYSKGQQESVGWPAINFAKLCLPFFFRTLFLAFLFHSLFFYKRYRIKASWSIASVALLLIHEYDERIWIFITGFYRDFVQSSWKVDDHSNKIHWIILATVVCFVLCWINFKKENKASALST
jgi:hypothetical protein